MNFQLDPKKVTVVTLFVQRILWTAFLGAVAALAALVQNDPALFGGAAGTMIAYTILTTIKDWANPKIPNK